MDPSNVLIVSNGAVGNFTKIGFLGSVNFAEYSIVIVQPAALVAEVKQQHYNLLDHRLNALTQWVHDGHTLIILGPHPSSFVAAPPKSSPISFQLENFVPFNRVRMEVFTGKRIETCGSTEASALLKPHLAILEYHTILSAPGLMPLLRVIRSSPGTPQIVGGYHSLGKGIVIYMPPATGVPLMQEAYLKSLIKLPAALSVQSVEYPAWADQYRTAAEREAIVKTDELVARKAELENLIASQDLVVETSRTLKNLFLANDAAFVRAVRLALEELGLLVVDGPHPRADLLARHGTRVAAIEVKGLEGPAKEKDVRQTMQWMAEVDSALAPDGDGADPDLVRYVEQIAALDPASERDRELDCKGLLIVGTFRKTDLQERKLPSFPAPVVRVIERADVCALTGLQLLGLVLQARSDPAAKPVIIQELFETRGVLQRAVDWRVFLE